MIAVHRTPRGYTARVILSTGKVVGEGYAQERQNAMYFACIDAIAGGHPQAACGNATMLSARDEAAVRAKAARER